MNSFIPKKDINEYELRLIFNSNDINKELEIKNGTIVKKNLFSRFTSGLTETKPNEELKERIKTICGKLLTRENNGTIDIDKIKRKLYTLTKFSNFNHSDSAQSNLILEIFFNKISSVYDRKNDSDKELLKTINQFKRAHFKQVLEGNEEYKTAKTKKDDITRAGALGQKEKEKNMLLEARMATKIAKMKILHSLGEFGRSEKGVTGTALIFDYREDGSERLLGVFKPDSSHASLSIKIGNFFRRIFGQHSLLSQRPLAQPTAEYVAYKASEFFDLNAVPPSSLIEVGEVGGVFQLAAQTFVKTLDNDSHSSKDIELFEAQDLKKSPDSDRPPLTILNSPKDKIVETELEAFQGFAVHDFLIGNLDGHDENWFVQLAEKKEDGEIKESREIRDISRIIGIDKANSFPVANPGILGLGGSKQYFWKETALAKEPFTLEMREKMKEITEEKVTEFIEAVKKSHSGFFEDSMKTLLQNRARVIREIATNPGSTPADLAAIVKDDDFDRYLKKQSQKRQKTAT